MKSNHFNDRDTLLARKY